MTIKKRLFIVGCPRSGTTLLQRLLTNHSEIYSFPESHFYQNNMRPDIKKRFVQQFLKDLGYGNQANDFFTWLIPKNSKKFHTILDEITLGKGKSTWLEKTPHHLFAIERINRFVPAPEFIHIIRDGQDVVASMYDLGQQYDSKWARRYRDLDYCVSHWYKCLCYHIKYKGQTHHHFIHYAKLAADAPAILKQLMAAIGIPYEDQMLNNTDESLFDEQAEPWKARTTSSIQSVSKFNTVLSPDQQTYVLNKLEQYPHKISDIL